MPTPGRRTACSDIESVIERISVEMTDMHPRRTRADECLQDEGVDVAGSTLRTSFQCELPVAGPQAGFQHSPGHNVPYVADARNFVDTIEPGDRRPLLGGSISAGHFRITFLLLINRSASGAIRRGPTYLVADACERGIHCCGVYVVLLIKSG